jgi:hypothetical protein
MSSFYEYGKDCLLKETNVGEYVGYYNKTGTIRLGKVTKLTKKGFTVKDVINGYLINRPCSKVVKLNQEEAKSFLILYTLKKDNV